MAPGGRSRSYCPCTASGGDMQGLLPLHLLLKLRRRAGLAANYTHAHGSMLYTITHTQS